MQETIQINWTNNEAITVSPVSINLVTKEKMHFRHGISIKHNHSIKILRMNPSHQIQQNLTYITEIRMISRCLVI